MNIQQLAHKLNELTAEGEGNDRVYVYSDNDPMDAELTAIEAREVIPFKPFWTNVDGYLIK